MDRNGVSVLTQREARKTTVGGEMNMSRSDAGQGGQHGAGASTCVEGRVLGRVARGATLHRDGLPEKATVSRTRTERREGTRWGSGVAGVGAAGAGSQEGRCLAWWSAAGWGGVPGR